MSQPKYIIENTAHFIEAMYALSDRGTITILASSRDLLNIAERFAENQVDGYEEDARRLAGHIAHLPGDDLCEFGLRLAGKRSSGAPIFSIAWSRFHEPDSGEQPEPPTDAEPAEPIEHPIHPFYCEAMIRHYLAEMSPGVRSEILTNALVQNLLDHAADSSRNPIEFNQGVKDLVTELQRTIEIKAGLA